MSAAAWYSCRLRFLLAVRSGGVAPTVLRRLARSMRQACAVMSGWAVKVGEEAQRTRCREPRSTYGVYRPARPHVLASTGLGIFLWARGHAFPPPNAKLPASGPSVNTKAGPSVLGVRMLEGAATLTGANGAPNEAPARGRKRHCEAGAREHSPAPLGSTLTGVLWAARSPEFPSPVDAGKCGRAGR
eukprot:scaffold30205_cov68-Phaeocystis_antarctica.AAC.3